MVNTSNVSINESIRDGNQNESWSADFPVIALSRSGRFWIMLVIDVPSIACSIFLLYHLITNKNLRKLLYNQAIIVLLFICLIYQLIDIPEYLSYQILDFVWPRIPIACLLWWFVGIGILNIIGIVMVWISIEWHILVFYEQLVNTSTKRLFFHYIPLIMFTIYGFIFYIYVICFPPCQNQYVYDADWCISPCYSDVKYLSMYDTIVNAILPTLLIVFFNATLLIRYILQKHRLHQRVRWRHCRKMVLQLVSISAIFLFFNLPMTGFGLAYIFGLPYGGGGQFELFTYFLCHSIPLLLPFVCLSFSTEILVKMRKILLCIHVSNRIRPQVIPRRRMEIRANAT